MARSPYADQARLAMARLYLDQGKADKAAEYLQQVANTATSEEFRNIARLRLARVLIFQEKYDEALKALADPGSRAFAPAFHDVRGDVYYAMGKQAEARSEYEQALNSEVGCAGHRPDLRAGQARRPGRRQRRPRATGPRQPPATTPAP